MRAVPGWGVVSAAVAPMLLLSGWAVAAILQPGSFNSVTRTISSLAAQGATDRWVMTLALLGVGTCYVLTGFALRPAAPSGRMTLVVAGGAVVLLAFSPEPLPGGHSVAHVFWAAFAFAALAVWPLAAARRGPSVPFGLRLSTACCAAALMICLLVWFAAELIAGGRLAGLAERALTELQAGWPLVVVLTTIFGQPAHSAMPVHARR